MTSLEYCPDCGHLHDITGTGGQESALHDTPAREAVEDAVADLDLDGVDEQVAALITMHAYDGRLADHELAATGAPMMATGDDGTPAACSECGSEPLKRMLLLVEVIGEEERLLALACEHCGFEPEMPGDWEFDIRETETATVHEWYCPECGGGEDGYPVWQDYLDIDEEHVSDWDDAYTT